MKTYIIKQKSNSLYIRVQIKLADKSPIILAKNSERGSSPEVVH